jgi:DHA2 family multidrug resistance protein
MGVMLGPILGPTLGGFLTETYNWRWVFFVNIPVGIVAFLGLVAVLPREKQNAVRSLDWLGFGLLSLGIGALQMMLDRGERLNWFDSPEIVLEATLAVTGFYLFIVHTLTAEKPFIDPALFRDRNLSAALLMMFIVGTVLLATMALVTPYLQNIMNYPVLTTGLVLAPRGVGTMIGMMVVGRLVTKIDPRLLMLFGFGLVAVSLWEMSGITPDVSNGWLVRNGLLQGAGLGFIFVPLQTLAFATLPQHFRTEGAALLSLVRNIGSSIGISVVTFLLVRNTSIVHANLAETVTPFRAPITTLGGTLWDLGKETGLAALDNEITRQAATIAYDNDFLLMTIVSLAAIPLLLLMRRPPPRAAGGPAHAAAMD